MTPRLPPHAASVLGALVAGTYRGGNDLRALDALARRGMVTIEDREKTINDAPHHSRAGAGVHVTASGVDWVMATPSALAWVRANRTERCLLADGA